MSKLLGCMFIAAGVAVGGLAMTLTGSEAAVDAAARPENVPEVIAPALASAPRKPIAAFETITVPNDPVSIARALQTELRRVGCYEGEINGVWSQTSKRATKAFVERVNAALPVDKPDYVLLSLVQGHQGAACGAPCPTGQVQGDRGVCSPAAIVAQAQKRQQAGQRVAAVVPSATPTMAAGGHGKANPAAAWTVKVEPAPAAEVERRPPLVTDAPRMALAGPPVVDAAASAVTPAAVPSTTPETEKAEQPDRKRKAKTQRPERRNVYAEAPRRSNFWVNDFFRKIDRDSF